MRLAIALCILGLAACDRVFPIHGGDDGDDVACPSPPVANCDPAAPDEDADLIVDDCDLCPADPGPIADQPIGGADRDGDGIGDRCDPSPDIAASCPRWFTGLGDPARFGVNDGWVEDGDGYIILNQPPPILTPEVFGGGLAQTVLDDDFTDASGYNGIWMMAHAAAQPDGYLCAIVTQAANDTGGLEMVITDGRDNPPTTTTSGLPSLDVSPGNWHVLELSVTANGIDCSSYDEVDSLEDTIHVDDHRFRSGRIGLASADSDSSFEYLDFVPE